MIRRAVAALLLLLLAAPAAAQEASRHSIERVAAFSRKVEQTLADRQAHVALVARVGRNPATMPGGMTFSHTGYWAYSQVRFSDGAVEPGYAAFNLYQEETQPGRSKLAQDFPLEFFADVQVLKAGIVIPSPALQQRLIETITSPVYPKLHNPAYSLVANPLEQRYQNCTSFVLDVLTAAVYRTDDIAQIKANQNAWFTPQEVKISGLRRTLGVMFIPGIRDDDHRGAIRTATFEAIATYMRSYGLVESELEIAAD